MSAWTDVSGTAWMNKGHNFSFKKYIEESFQESIPVVSQQDFKDHQVYEFEFSFSDSNIPAAKAVQQMVNDLKEARAISVDIQAIIRFLN